MSDRIKVVSKDISPISKDLLGSSVTSYDDDEGMLSDPAADCANLLG